ncbi:MAG TPA: transglutaminaseTgpA domain-containing protein, partial [Geobacteraceae bacterium]|nr:transglutaminaseTgpA domain-containing protein [Geobacteraceae bacterium]
MPRIKTILQILLYFAAFLGYLPLAPWLHPFPRVAVPAAIILAAIADRRGAALKDRAALLVSIACFLFYFFQFSRHNVVEPAANMLAIFLAIRIAGEKSSRNFLQTLTLSMFCLAASTLFDLSPRFVVYLVLLLLAFTTSMVLLTFESRAPGFAPSRKELRSILTVALLQPLVTAPLAVFLFFLLPRTQLPIWHGLTRAGSDRSGISETVKAGEKSSISSGSGVVFRAEMPKQPSGTLYWRVIVLNTIKNSEWIRKIPPPEKSLSREGKELSLNIFLEPGRLPYLPTLNIPDRIPGYRGSPQDDRIFPASALTGGRRSYQVLSQSGARLFTVGKMNRDFYSIPPEKAPPRLSRLVSGAVAGLRQDRKKLDALETAFANIGLSYASSNLPTGPDAIDKFLFEGKKGHCELFAVSFATALRLAGLPARLVGGYYGGDYNEMAGYYIVTEERAHVWVEVWIEGDGWMTIDPSRFAVNFEEGVSRKRSGYELRVRLFLDSLAYYWNRMVITYDFESQFSAASKAGAELKGLREVKIPKRKIMLAVAVLLV